MPVTIGAATLYRLLASILFTATFEILDRIADDEQRKKLAWRVHDATYNRMVGNETEGFQAGSVGPGRDAEPSPGAGAKAPDPRPPR